MRLSMSEAYQSLSPWAVMPSMKSPEGGQFLPEVFVEALGDLLNVQARREPLKRPGRCSVTDSSSRGDEQRL